MASRVYAVKVRVNGEPGWSGSPIWVHGESTVAGAEKRAKVIYAQRTGQPIGNIDAKAIRFDARSVYPRRGRIE